MFLEILFFIVFSLLCILIGWLFAHFLNRETSVFAVFPLGLTVLLALLHIFAYPLMLLHASFSFLFLLYSGVIIILLGFSLASFIRGKDYLAIAEGVCSIWKGVTRSPFLFAIFATLFCALIYTGILCYHPTQDDGYYLARSMEVLTQNRLDIPAAVSWYGEPIEHYAELTDASTLAFFVAYFSKLFQLSPAILCRRSFALIMIVAHFCVLYTVLNSVCTWNKNRKTEKILVVFFLYILFQLSGEKVCSTGYWLTGFIWQGKAMLMALIFPLLLASSAGIVKKLEDGVSVGREWWSVAVLLTAGISVSTVGLFLPAILFFTYGFAYLFSTRFQTFRKIILPAILVCLPVIICALISYFSIATVNTYYFEIGKTEDWSWIGQFWRANDVFPFCLFVLSIIFILIKGNRIQRMLLGIAPVILFATFLNPLLAGFVSTYVTSSEVYWRLFWLLPIYLLPAFVLTKLLEQLTGGKLQNGILCVLAGFAILIGYRSETYYIVRPKTALALIKDGLHLSYPRRANAYGISESVFAFVNAIADDWNEDGRPHLLTRYDTFFETRQYTEKIIIYWDGQEKEIIDGRLSQEDFMKTYDSIQDLSFLQNALEALDADYICLRNDAESPPASSGFLIPLCTSEGITLYRIV